MKRFKIWASALVALLCVLAPGTTAQGGTGAGGGRAAGPDEGGETVPAKAELPSAFEVVGLPGDLAAVVRGVRGRGSVSVAPLDPSRPRGAMVVTFEGDLEIQLDRRALARGKVAFRFRSGTLFGPGVVQLHVNRRNLGPLRLDSSTGLRMPLAGIYGTSAGGGAQLGLHAIGANGELYRASARAQRDTVTVIQRTDPGRGQRH